MLNLLKLVFVSSFLFSSASLQASIITAPLSQDAYVTYNGLDWAWAAPVSVQFRNCSASVDNPSDYLSTLYDNIDPSCENQLFSADVHEGWGFFTGTQQELVAAMPDLSSFDDGNGGFIDAFDYWNTTYSFDNTGGINPYYVQQGFVVSDWTTDAWRLSNLGYYNVLYVREATGNTPQPIPEPSTLMIFTLGLIALASKKRIIFCTNK